MSLSVYLSGAIDDAHLFATHWRLDATKALKDRGYKVNDCYASNEERSLSYEEIVQKNLFLQKRSDILLVEYLLPNRSYIGTDFEMAWAKIHGQPSVVICSHHHINRTYMKYMATKLVKDLEEAVEYVSINYPNT